MIPLVMITAVVLFLAGSFLRFYLPLFWNKLLLCVCSFALMEVILKNDFGDFSLFIYGAFVLLASYSFSWYGVCGSVILIAAFSSGGTDIQWYPMPLITLLLTGVVGTIFHRQLRRKLALETVWQTQMYKQSRHLSILKEIGIAIQSTMEPGKLLHIILTAITAGYGLGFNRALLFLMDESDSRLKGELGIGSMNEQEGMCIWNAVVSDRMNLGDFIAMKDNTHVRDYELNDLLRATVITLSSNHFIQRAITEQKPYLVRSIDPTDYVQIMLSKIFHMNSFAVVPMLNQGKAVGIIVVDNNINHEPIDIEEVDSIIPLAAQASIAIENSRLYKRTQQMSITDGLTGLYNQRYMQETLHNLAVQADSKGSPLSLIILDIDFFKHYNDTNGHLEGNKVLIELADIITGSVGKLHVPCRFGGEEFVVLLPETSRDEAQRVAELIRSKVERHPFHNAKAQPDERVTVSVGLAAYRHGMSIQQLQDRADTALYEAKRSGKNQVVVFREGA
ncbi:diguanylate cyclase [Paenibacillus oenotherae]|uniref:Diguanylate cyclase n=1 Tax=Paenibacillus oenotherae TaxID=1435645 RepID=A0ABS7DA36_9BACL|nr:diguanylate cyclase [Paenibacillus oenotherae]MBW7476367.1 diguanylate cyclase [Paenibacillus oenotherae]